MKKGLLLILGMLMMVSTAEAIEGIKPNSKKGYYNYVGARPIKFMERGIQFYIFPNGDVDFNTRSHFRTQYYYRNGRRYKKRTPHNRVRVQRDYRGRVKRVGNVSINYNYFGNVTRVGSVFIDYQRGRRLTRVGGLRIKYDRYGRVRYFGNVKHQWNNRFASDDYYFDGFIYDYDDDFFYRDSFYDDYQEFDEDDDYFYYKSKKGKKGLKKGKIIKRKKLNALPKRENDRKRRK